MNANESWLVRQTQTHLNIIRNIWENVIHDDTVTQQKTFLDIEMQNSYIT